MDPEPTLAELCLLAHLTVDSVLFGDYWWWEPLIVGGQLQFGAVVFVGGTGCAFDGWPERGGGVGDGVVGTFVEGRVRHWDNPRNLRGWEVEGRLVQTVDSLEGRGDEGCGE